MQNLLKKMILKMKKLYKFVEYPWRSKILIELNIIDLFANKIIIKEGRSGHVLNDLKSREGHVFYKINLHQHISVCER